jgi:hypothetical protein
LASIVCDVVLIRGFGIGLVLVFFGFVLFFFNAFGVPRGQLFASRLAFRVGVVGALVAFRAVPQFG